MILPFWSTKQRKAINIVEVKTFIVRLTWFLPFFMQLLLTSSFPNHANCCLFMIIVSYECKIIKLISPIWLWGDHLMDQVDQSVVENDNEQNIFSCLEHNSFDFMTKLSQHVNIGPTLSRQRPLRLKSVHNHDPKKFYDSWFGNNITPRSISYTSWKLNLNHRSNTVPNLTSHRKSIIEHNSKNILSSSKGET